MGRTGLSRPFFACDLTQITQFETSFLSMILQFSTIYFIHNGSLHFLIDNDQQPIYSYCFDDFRPFSATNSYLEVNSRSLLFWELIPSMYVAITSGEKWEILPLGNCVRLLIYFTWATSVYLLWMIKSKFLYIFRPCKVSRKALVLPTVFLEVIPGSSIDSSSF